MPIPGYTFVWIGANGGDLGDKANWTQPDPDNHPRTPGIFDTAVINGGGGLTLHGSLTSISRAELSGTLTLNTGAQLWPQNSASISGDLTLTGISQFICMGPIDTSQANSITVNVGSHFTVASDVDDEHQFALDGASLDVSGTLSVGAGNGANAQLTIADSTLAHTLASVLAGGQNSHASATVDGSAWYNDTLIIASQGTADVSLTNGAQLLGNTQTATNITVGDAGDGELDINQGTFVSASFLTLGNQASGLGVVDVEGGTLNASQAVTVGNAGIGDLEVVNHAQVTVADLALGSAPGGDGTLNVDFSTLQVRSQQNGPGGLTVGVYGDGHLTITDLATVTAGTMEVAVYGGSQADILVDDATLAVDRQITVGEMGSATMTVQNTAVVQSGSLNIGNQQGSNSQVTIDNASWQANVFIVGGGFGPGTGNLTIENGSVVTVTGSGGFFGVGVNTGSTGKAVVTGTTSGPRTTLDVSGAADDVFVVGNAGTGELDINNNALVRSQSSSIGSMAGGGQGKVVLDHAGWISFSLFAGGFGSGELDVQNFAALNTQRFCIGTNGSGVVNISGHSVMTAFDDEMAGAAGSTASLDVTGQGTTLTIANADPTQNAFVSVGTGGNATLIVEDQATMSADNMNVAGFSTSTSSATIRSGASLTIHQGITVGAEGNGSMSVNTGASVSSQQTVIGSEAGSIGTANVDAASWTANQFIVGNGFGGANAFGFFNITDGAAVTVTGSAGQFMIGEQQGGAGFVDVAGATTTLDVSGSGDLLVVGQIGNGTLIVENGATVAADRMTVASFAGSNGNVTIETGATLTAKQVNLGDFGGAQMNVTGGSKVTTQTTFIGNGAGANAFATVDASTWTANSFTVGGGFLPGGIGSLTVKDAGAVTVTGAGGSFNVGYFGGNGFVDVTGANSKLDVSGDAADALNVGWQGQGAIVVEQGGALASRAAILGEFQGAQGLVTIDNATWTATTITDGGGGRGGLEIQNHAAVNATSVTVAQFAAPNVVDTLDVNASTLNVSQDLTLGFSGSANVTSEGGGIINVGNNLNLAQQFGSNASLDINDANANLAVAHFLNVGIAGSASATFENAAIVSADFVRIGGGTQSIGVNFAGNGTGTMTVTGQGTVLTVGNSDATRAGLGVGFTGNGTLNITDHAVVNVGVNTNLGVNPGASGILNVNTSAVLNTQDLIIGGGTTAGGPATATVSTGAVINATMAASSTTASVVIYSGSKLDVSGGGSVDAGSGATTIAGAVHIGAGVGGVGGGSLVGAGTVIGSIVDDNIVSAKGGTLTLKGPVTGTGSLSIQGGAVLELTSTDSANVVFHGSNVVAGVETLRLDTPSGFTGALIGGFRVGDIIDLVNTSVTAVSIDGTNHLLNVTTSSGALHFGDNASLPTGGRFNFTSDGHGGTNLVVSDIGVAFNSPGGVAVTNDTGSSNTDAITQDGHVTLSGTINGNTTNATVQIFDNGISLGFATVTGAAWTLSADVTGTEGANQFSALATSSNNAISRATASRIVTVDHTQPSLAFTAVALANDTGAFANDYVTSDGHVTLSGTAGDSINAVTVTVFDGTTSLGSAAISNGQWSLSADLTALQGAHSFSATANDVAGNTRTVSATQTVTIDTALPAVTEQLAHDTGVLSTDRITSDATLTGSGDPNAIVHFNIDGQSIAATATAGADGTWSFLPGGLADGFHTVVASETDLAGNTGTASLSFTVDTTAPTLTPVANQTDEATSAAGAVAAFAATATDLVDGTDPVVFKEGTSVVHSGDTFAIGIHTITASATDAAGHTSTESFTVTVRDTTAPTLTPVANQTDEATSAAGAVAAFAATATDLVDGTDPVAFKDGSTTVHSGDTFGLGSHTITASATDAAGNSRSETFTITVQDTTAPDTTILSGPAAQTSSTSAAFTLGGTDAVGVAGFRYKLDNANWTSTTSNSLSFAGLAAGGHTLAVAAFDAAGNADQTPASYAWSVQSGSQAVVTSVVANPNTGDEGIGKAVTISVGFSQTVTVTGTPTLSLNDGGMATYVGGSGTGTLSFSYTVGTGQSTPALAVTGINLPNNAGISGSGGAAADLSGGHATFAGLQIDGARPTVALAGSSQGVFQPGDLVTIVLGLSEAVSVSGGVPTLALSDGGIATFDAARSSATSLVFDYTVGNKDAATSSLSITALRQNGASVLDAAGNSADVSAAVASLAGTYVNINPNGSNTVNTGANAMITLGNGTNAVTAGDGSTITVGNGNNSVTAGANSTITAGNGTNTVTSGAFSNIVVGNGNDTVYAGAHSTVTVGNGNDTVYAGAYDVINLGNGHETVAFRLSANSTFIGSETINGFDANSDVIQFDHALFGNAAAVMSAARQVGQDTVITRDSNDSITLHGVAMSSLSANNFHFA